MNAGRGDQQKHDDNDDDFYNRGHEPDQGDRALRWRAVGQARENRAGQRTNQRNDERRDSDQRRQKEHEKRDRREDHTGTRE